MYTIHGSKAFAQYGTLHSDTLDNAFKVAKKTDWKWALGEFPMVEITDDATGVVVGVFIGGERYFE